MAKLRTKNFYCDFETYKTVEYIQDKPIYYNNVYLYGVAYFDGFDTLKTEYFTDLHSFFDFLSSYKMFNIHLYFYNATFDITALIYEIVKSGLKIKHDIKLNENNIILNAKFDLNGLKIKIVDLWLWNRNFKLADYMDLLGTDEESKLIIDYDKFNLKLIQPTTDINSWYFEYINTNNELKTANYLDELEYLKNDLIILPKIHFFIEQTKINIINTTKLNPALVSSFKGLTTSGYSKYIFNILLDNNFDSLFRKKITKNDYLLQRSSYFGGFTTYNNKVLEYETKDNEQIVSFDINSMYPYIMEHYKLPYGELLDTPPQDDHMTWVFFKCKNFFYKSEYNFLSTNFIPLKFSSGVYYLIHSELFELFKRFCIIEDLEYSYKYQRTTEKLKPIINSLYKLKEESTDIIKRNTAKLLLNSIYGKFAERSYQYEIFFNEQFTVIEQELKDYQINYQTTLTGNFVTNIARIIIFKTILSVLNQNKTILYIDTDSIKFITTKEDDFKYLNVHNTKLGAWKFEGSYTNYLNPNKSKRYLLYNTNNNLISFACGGFALSVIKNLSLENLKIFFNSNNNVKCVNMKVYRDTNKYNQPILINTDINTQNRKDITHELTYIKQLNSNNKIEYLVNIIKK